MPKTVLAVYRNQENARAAIASLRRGSLHPSDVSVVSGAQTLGSLPGFALERIPVPDYGALQVGGALATQLVADAPRGLHRVLEQAGIPDPDSRLYSEAVRRGATLVLARVPDVEAERAADVLESHGPEDPDQLGAELAPARLEPSVPLAEAEEEAAEAEQELALGAQELERGGVLVRREVTEIPIEETVEVREEVAEVERRPADRPGSAADPGAFQPAEFLLVDTAEQVSVTKVPRVVEEIVIRKRRQVRQEVVRDTVRRTELKIEPKRR